MKLMIVMLCAYLLGSVSGSLWLGRLRRVDIRELGSGNAGGTNALRTQGWRFALLVALIDVGKGALAVWLSWNLAPTQSAAVWLAILAAMVGHVWPLFHNFRGGKGAATFIGGLLVAWPVAVIVVLSGWLVILLLSGYVGLATVIAGALLWPLVFLLPMEGYQQVFCIVAPLFLLYTHRGNVQRLYQGNEYRFERARLFRKGSGA